MMAIVRFANFEKSSNLLKNLIQAMPAHQLLEKLEAFNNDTYVPLPHDCLDEG